MIVEDNFMPLELGSSDVILGMQSLNKLGEMHINWQTLTMTFSVASEGDTKRDSSLSRASVSLKSKLKTVKLGKIN